ncbi:MAG: cation:proton antiporter [Rhodospirillales bacterium]|nr:cation:proton antiporter [Alphaproteobacteria bacterium]MBL6948728.1 cation:proton antiporter [Rhodospirillales bacterium]
METHVFLQVLLIILLTARIFAELATRLKSPSVIGELVAGVVLGPSLLGWIEPFEAIKLLAEIGIVLLLFKVGLETDLVQLAQTGWKSIIVAIGGVLLPLVLGALLSFKVFGLSLLVSLFIGGTLTATSIGITVRVLTDLKVQHRPEGQIVLGAAVLDDIFGVVLLALLYEFAIGGGVSLINSGKVLLFIGVFFVLAPVAAKIISVVFQRLARTTEVPGLIPTMMVSLVLFFSWLAKMIGAPEMLGGFAAGLALSRRFFIPLGVALHADPRFARRIEVQMRPIVNLFTPIFFVMVGLSLNLREIDWSSFHIWGLSLALFVAAGVGKFAGALVIRESWSSRFVIGVAMIPRGEVGLIFAELGRESRVLDNETYAALIIVIVLTTLLPPLVMKWFYNSRFGERLTFEHQVQEEKP